MVTVFILGPSEWRDPDHPWDERSTPMEARRAIALALNRMNIPTVVMEDEPDRETEATRDKFFRLLEDKDVSDILCYWPPVARIDAAEDELVMLAVRERFQPTLRPRITLFGHTDTVGEAENDGETFLQVRDEVGRSSYLGQIPRHLPTDLHEWSDHDGLFLSVQEWARAMFPEQVADDQLARELAPLNSVLQHLREG